MRKILVAVLLVVVALVVVAVTLPFVLPRDMIKVELEKRVSAALGRDFVVEGPLTFRPWRPFALSLADVRLANPGWAENPDLAQIALVDVDIDALAYLGGTLDIVRLAIEKPVLSLEVDPTGVPSWQLETAEKADGDGKGGGGGGLPEIRIGEIALTDGAVTYLDHGTGERREFSDIALGARTDTATGELVIDGGARSAGERATLQGRIGDLASLLAGEQSPVNLELAAPGLGAVADGEVSPDGKAVLAVSVDMAPRTLLDWLGQPVALPAGSLEVAKLTVDVETAPDGLGLRALSLEVDKLLVQGDLDLALGGRPRLSGRLDLGDLNLAPYLPAAAGPGAGTPAAEPPAAPPAEPEGWSTEPFDLPLPLPLDLDLELVMSSLRETTLETGPGRFHVEAGTDRTSIEIAELALYGGSATGGAALSSQAPLKVDARLDATGIELLPVLRGAAGVEYLEGTGNLKLAIEGQGDSVAALVESLAGDGALLVRDGAILGINIAATIRQVMTLGVESAAAQPQRTDFAEAGGTFTIEKGIVQNDDLSLRAPVLRIEGAGQVALPARTLDYRLTPHVASTLEGQDASGSPNLQLGVPLVIEGPWASPSVRLDLGGALSGDITDPAALAETVTRLAADPASLEALQKAFGGELPGSLGDALKQLPGVLGGPKDGGDGDARDPAKQLRDALGGLLGR